MLIKNTPLVLLSFFTYLIHGSLLFGSAVVTTGIRRIVDDDTDNVNLVARIILLELAKGFVQQWKPNGRKILRFNRHENVPRSMIGGLRENRFGRGTIYDDEIFFLKMIRDKLGENPWVRLDRVNQVV